MGMGLSVALFSWGLKNPRSFPEFVNYVRRNHNARLFVAAGWTLSRIEYIEHIQSELPSGSVLLCECAAHYNKHPENRDAYIISCENVVSLPRQAGSTAADFGTKRTCEKFVNTLASRIFEVAGKKCLYLDCGELYFVSSIKDADGVAFRLPLMPYASQITNIISSVDIIVNPTHTRMANTYGQLDRKAKALSLGEISGRFAGAKHYIRVANWCAVAPGPGLHEIWHAGDCKYRSPSPNDSFLESVVRLT